MTHMLHDAKPCNYSSDDSSHFVFTVPHKQQHQSHIMRMIFGLVYFSARCDITSSAGWSDSWVILSVLLFRMLTLQILHRVVFFSSTIKMSPYNYTVKIVSPHVIIN